MDLRHLRYFVSVAEHANVSRAALRVHISQPALSRRIRELEAELGVRLFDRVGRQVRLTAEGDDLLRQAREVLARADSLDERAIANSGVANNNPVTGRAICWIVAGHTKHHLDVLHERYGV